MKLPPISVVVFIIMLWAALFAAQGVYAADPRPDMRVLIDISGSMKKTDPENLRIPAAKLLMNLAPDDSRFGVWSFGQYVNNLVPVDEVSAKWKEQTVNKLEAINSAGLYTNIGLALEKASMGQTTPDPDWERTLVLLSDGMVDIAKDPGVNAQEKARILDQVIPALKQAGFRIHSVALSKGADQQFLKEVALRTGGSFSLAESADDLLKTFVAASDQVNQPEQVPLEGDHFDIDESVQEFTALIFRQSSLRETQLISPDGTIYSLANGSRNVSWFADKKYDLITVYNPLPGRWKVVADLDPGNRVTVVSDLNLKVEGLPENVLEGERLTMTMSLDEQGRIITNPNFLQLLDITFRQETEAGETFEGKLSADSDGNSVVPDDGLYTARLGRTITRGDHSFSVLVDGKTFKRKKSVRMTVHHDVLKVETGFQDQDGAVHRHLLASPIAGLVNLEDVNIVAQITDPEGKKSLQNGKLEDQGQYRIDVPPFGALGEYEVLIKVSGTSVNGKQFELMQGPYHVDYTPVGMLSQEEPVTPPGPNETFEASALEVPSLEVEELPPDDMPPLSVETPAVAAPAIAVDEQGAELEQAEEGSNWLLLAGIFVVGNLLVIGGGVYLYLKLVRKTDEEQTRVVEEITRMQQQKAEEKAKAAVSEPVTEPEPADEEATQIRVEEPAAPSPQQVSTAAAVAEDTYVNDADPLDLEDDSLIEVDDEFDDEPVADESLDDLDMMFSEQNSDEQTEEQLNQAIDDILEQPTAMASESDSEDEPSHEEASDDDEDSIEEKYPGFDHDEFMLDNPTKI